MKKNVSLVAMLGLVLAFGLVFLGCDDGSTDSEDELKTVTFTLAKASATSFTVTVDGADWKSPFDGNEFNNLFDGLKVVHAIGQRDPYGSDFYYTISGKVLTATLIGDNTLSGTLVVKPDGGSSVTDGGSSTYEGGKTNYLSKPTEGITFP